MCPFRPWILIPGKIGNCKMLPKKKICIISLYDFNIDGRVQRQIGSLKASYDVTLIYQIKSEAKPPDTNGFVSRPIKVFTRKLPKKSIFHFVMYLEFILLSIFHGIKCRADIYQGNDLSCAIPAYIITKTLKAGFIYDIRELYVEIQTVKLKKIWKMIERVLITAADLAISVNQERSVVLKKWYDLKSLPKIVLNCPYTCHKKVSDKVQAAFETIKKKHSISKIILYQGAIMKGRHLENLIMSSLEFEKGIAVMIMGPDNGHQKALEKIVCDHELSDRIFFFDPIAADELVSFAKNADICVLFYEKTGLNNYYCAPTKLYEYLAAGVPIIASELPFLVNITKNEAVGATVNSENASDIAMKINAMIFDKTKLQLYSSQALNISKVKYNWEEQSKRYLRWISEIETP